MIKFLKNWLYRRRLNRLKVGDKIHCRTGKKGIFETHLIVSLKQISNGNVDIKSRLGSTEFSETMTIKTEELWEPFLFNEKERESEKIILGKVRFHGYGIDLFEKRKVVDISRLSEGLVTIKRFRWQGDANTYDKETPWPERTETITVAEFGRALSLSDSFTCD